MFKKFSVKEDVSSSTSLKSSVQRHIRTAFCQQVPFVNLPAYSDTPKSAAPAPAPVAEPKEEEQDEDVKSSGKGGKKKGSGGKKGGKNKGGKEEAEPVAAEAEGEQQVAVIDEIWPKKDALGITKCKDHINIYTLDGVPVVWQHFDGPFVPSLKILHKYPEMLPHVQIDRGAIKFLLAGANMMAPGLLSKGGHLPDGLPAGALVAIHAEGKEVACGIGKLVASSEEIKASGKNVAVEVFCYIGDDLWLLDRLS
ncbi:hypothetical protein QFC21_000520 [Naganishia friedmannii]|uniref:Uncharacterized protein n=1 Tax=Naganishia friedmannii TaxID=89922 RepID=A0ACC2WCR6_9TREE|nr:hypothetical protein QFC21_000520 [Naganishia friedmannii]